MATPRWLLNIDLGELDDEPDELYALADVANIACGGHAGDRDSVRRALARCAAHGTRVGVHPSFVDRANFGRAKLDVAPATLRAQVGEQCDLLAGLAAEAGLEIGFAKAHGALYHAADRDPAIARAVIAAVVEALGYEVRVLGPAGGALEQVARGAGLTLLCEGFADRGTRDDGSLIPRGQPGALVTDPIAARANAVRLARSGRVQTLCVHGDTPGAVAIARNVRAALDALEHEP